MKTPDLRAVLVGGAGLALTLGLAASSSAFDRDYICKDPFTPFYIPARTSPNGSRFMKSNRRGSSPGTFRMPKPSGTTRVFILGESVARAVHPLSLKRSLETALPGRNFEVLNTGMGAYASARISLVLSELLEYEPDLLILLSGNNEDYESMERCPNFLQRINEKLRRWTAYRELQDKVHAGTRKDSPSARREARLASFERNLRVMARAAKERGVPLLMATLPANLRDFAPSGMPPFDKPAYAEAWVHLEKGDLPETVAGFRAFLKSEPRDPFAHFFLARALESMGKHAQARDHYLQAVEWDPRGDRCAPAKNKLIRGVSREEGAALADLEKAFARAAPHGLVGDPLMVDGVHWYFRTGSIAVQEIAETILRLPGFGAEGKTPTDAQRDRPQKDDSEDIRLETKDVFCYAFEHLRKWGTYQRNGEISERGMAYVERLMKRKPGLFFDVTGPEHRKAAAELIKESSWVQGLRDDMDQWWPVYLQHVAEAYRRQGDPRGSIPVFEAAIKLAPGRYLIRLHRGLALAGAGRKEEAARELKSLEEHRERHPEIPGLARAYGLETR